MQRAPWIIGGSIILAAIIVAVALASLNKDEVPTTPREQPGVGAEQRAQDRAAQSSLRSAMAVAKVGRGSIRG